MASLLETSKSVLVCGLQKQFLREQVGEPLGLRQATFRSR